LASGIAWLAVALLLGGCGASHHSTTSTRKLEGIGRPGTDAQVQRLIAHIRAFRRAQSAADREGNKYLNGAFIPSLTRLVAMLSDHRRVYLVIVRGASELRRSSYGILTTECGVNAGPATLETVSSLTGFPYPCCSDTTDGGTTLFVGLLPNGVGHVRWTWARQGRRRQLTVNVDTTGSRRPADGWARHRARCSARLIDGPQRLRAAAFVPPGAPERGEPRWPRG
jgi:hypothetical protein